MDSGVPAITSSWAACCASMPQAPATSSSRGARPSCSRRDASQRSISERFSSAPVASSALRSARFISPSIHGTAYVVSRVPCSGENRRTACISPMTPAWISSSRSEAAVPSLPARRMISGRAASISRSIASQSPRFARAMASCSSCTSSASAMLQASSRLVMRTSVPLPGEEVTLTPSMNDCISEKPIPVRSCSGWLV